MGADALNVACVAILAAFGEESSNLRPLVVGRSTTGLVSNGLRGNRVDRNAAEGTGVDTMDENSHLAEVRVAGSNPFVRSKESPGQRGRLTTVTVTGLSDRAFRKYAIYGRFI
jgi:hypothetical protein